MNLILYLYLIDLHHIFLIILVHHVDLFSLIIDLLEGKQSLSVGDLITLKINMFLGALLWILCIYFGHFYELMVLNEVYSLF